MPAGEVIARLDVLGINMPWAATIGITIMVVRLPGIPPIQCLSTTIDSPQLRVLPELTIAFVKKNISSRSKPLWLQATKKAAISILE